MNVDIIVEPTEDPAKSVVIPYRVEDVRAAVISQNPVKGVPGTKISVAVEYFEYPSEVFVRINDGNPIPDDKVDILPVSNLHKTIVVFQWINQPTPGKYEVSLTPKGVCYSVRQSRSFFLH